MTAAVAPARRIARNTAIQAAADASTKIATLAMYALLARAVGEHAFGAFTLATALILLVDLAGLGTDVVLSRDVAEDPSRAGEQFRLALVARAGAGGVAVAVTWAIVLVAHAGPDLRAAVLLLSLARFAELLTGTAFGVFRGIEELGAVATALIVQRSLTVAAAVLGLALGGGVATVSAIYLAGACVGMATAGALLARRMPVRGPVPGLRAAALLLRRSAPLGLSGLSVILLARADSVILAGFAASAAVGRYGAAYRLFEGMSFIPSAVGAASLAGLTRAAQEGGRRLIDAQAAVITAATLLLGCVGGFLLVYAHPLIHALYGATYADATPALRWLGIATAFSGTYVAAAFALAAQGRYGDVTKTTTVAVVVNVVMCFVLIPPFHETGAAAAMAVTEVALGVGMLGVVAHRARGPVLASIARSTVATVSGMAGIAATLLLPEIAGVLLAPVAFAGAALVVQQALWPQDLQRLLSAVPVGRLPQRLRRQ